MNQVDFDTLYPDIIEDEVEEAVNEEKADDIDVDEEEESGEEGIFSRMKVLSDPEKWWTAIPMEERHKIQGFMGNPSPYFQAVNNWKYTEALEYIDSIWSLVGVPMFLIGHVFEIRPFHHAIPFAKHICHQRPNYGVLAMLVMPKPHKPNEYQHYGKIRLLAIEHLDHHVGSSYSEQQRQLEDDPLVDVTIAEKVVEVENNNDFKINWSDESNDEIE